MTRWGLPRTCSSVVLRFPLRLFPVARPIFLLLLLFVIFSASLAFAQLPSAEMKRVAMVTGASSGIGVKIAEGLARIPGTSVIIVGRDETKCRRAQDEIRKATGNSDVSFEVVDLSSYRQITAFAARYRSQGRPLHILINNAVVAPEKKEFSSEGLEMQFATNVMGYFWMIDNFKDILKRSAPARIVNIASRYAMDLALTDLQFDKRHYDTNVAYRQSKQANRVLTAAFASRLKADNITVNACHPGVVNTNLLNAIGFNGSDTPEEGAKTPILLATSGAVANATGKWYVYEKEEPDKFMLPANAQQIEALYRACEETTASVAAKVKSEL